MKLRRCTTVFLLCCLLAVGACASKKSADLGKANASPVRVAEFFKSYVHAFNDRDMNKLMAHYSPDSQSRVFGSEEGYTLDKEQLLAAFEMKKASWESREVRFVDFQVLQWREVNGLIRVNIAFHVESSTWNGEYPVFFEMEDKDGKLTIMNENMS